MSKKTQTKRKSSAKKQPVKEEIFGKEIISEILIILLVGFALLLTIGNFGFGGKVGRFMADVFFGIFGVLEFIFPFFLVGIIIFWYANRKDIRGTIKSITAIFIFILLCGFIELIVGGWSLPITLAKAYEKGATLHKGGGVIGGILSSLLFKSFGLLGSYLFYILALMIAFVIMTRKTLLRKLNHYLRNRQPKIRESKEKVVGEKVVPVRTIEEKKPVALDIFDLNEEKIERDTKSKSSFTEVIDHPVEKAPRKKLSFLKGEGNLSNIEKAPNEITSQEVEVFELPVMEFVEPIQALENEVDTSKEPLMENAVDGATTKPKKLTPKDTEEVTVNTTLESNAYQKPPVSLLKTGTKGDPSSAKQVIQETAQKLQDTLDSFGVEATVTDVSRGPSVTQFQLTLAQGVKVSKILNLSDDIKLALAVPDIRIEAPIPGMSAVGIEVPNKENTSVAFREIIESTQYQEKTSPLSFALGKDLSGNIVVTDIAAMPHLLIAGATGSGKSVCINTIIMSILYKASPEEVRMIMIDPKVVELSVYNQIPHLLIPVVTDPKKAAGALNWAVAEMTDRYNKFATYNVRNLAGYNKKVAEITATEDETKPEKLPQILIIVDELADLMMVASKEVEESICRLAQLARAAGIHLIIATQRPSVNVITGLIKANMPSRIAFAVTSGVDSRTILDMYGAEKLLGKGDMLFFPQDYKQPARIQGAFVSDKEVADVTAWIANHHESPVHSVDITEEIKSATQFSSAVNNDRDEYFKDAGLFIIEKEKASIGMLQRAFKIGFNRASRIMEQLNEAGVVSEEAGTKPRDILMTKEEFENIL